jgi:hypothetical protein
MLSDVEIDCERKDNKSPSWAEKKRICSESKATITSRDTYALVHHFMILDALRAESANQISGVDVPYVDRREGGDDESRIQQPDRVDPFRQRGERSGRAEMS